MKRRNFIRQSGLLTAGFLVHQQMLQAYGSTAAAKTIQCGYTRACCY